MPQQNSSGKYILSAGEIGTFAVCAESWRLRRLEKVRVNQSEQAQRGAQLHQEWASQQEEAVFFAKGIKVILMLVAVSIVLGVLANY